MGKNDFSKLTDSTEEFDIDTVFASDSIFSIPYFQREYIWNKTQLNQFKEDLQNLVEEEDITFLGAIILYTRNVPAGRSKTYEVVDGQQRLTTITLFFIGLIVQLCKAGEFEEAAQLFERYIYLGKSRKEISNLKLHPCKQDRAQFNSIIEGLLIDFPDLKGELGNINIAYLTPTGNKTGNITKQLEEIEKFLSKEKEEGGIDRIFELYQVLVKKFTLVQIIIKDPTACPRIFERLNHRGQKVSIGDLVRNEIFSKTVNVDAPHIDQIYHSVWEPFYKKFSDSKSFEGFFFPYGLIKKSSLRKSEVFTYLRSNWNIADSPEDIIKELSVYQDSYLFLIGKLECLEVNKKVNLALKKLINAKIPSSTFPFLMQTIQLHKQKKLEEKPFLEVIDVIDSFLTRRAICGYEPTGLHAVFKGLFDDCDQRPTKNNVIQNIKRHKTVPWPSDEEFKNAIQTRPIYGSGIASYVIKEYDKGLGTDVPTDKPEIEHILPQKLTSEWREIFSDDDHSFYVDVWANLIPLSAPLNKTVRQKIYLHKQKHYLKDSMYATPRLLASEFKKWDITSLVKRTRKLQTWAVRRWPY